MSYQVRLNDRIAEVDLLARDGNMVSVVIDGVEYAADIQMVEQGVYSILINNQSYNVELFPGEEPRTYSVTTKQDSFVAEIIDAEARYRMNRSKGLASDSDKILLSPMPGKVVKVMVTSGDQVVVGQPLVVVSAMKMESEFKAKVDGTVAEVRVKDGDTVDAKQVMVIIE